MFDQLHRQRMGRAFAQHCIIAVEASGNLTLEVMKGIVTKGFTGSTDESGVAIFIKHVLADAAVIDAGAAGHLVARGIGDQGKVWSALVLHRLQFAIFLIAE